MPKKSSFNKCTSLNQPNTQERAQISDLTNEWVRDNKKMRVKTLNIYCINDLILLLGHKKADKAKILKIILFYIKWLKLNPNQAKERCHAPFRVTLAPSRENAASKSRTLAPLGLLLAATRAKLPYPSAKTSMKQGWCHGPHGWRPRPSKANVPLKRAQPP